VAPAFETPRAAADVLTLTWFGHSSTLLQVGGLNVLTDPVWSMRASPVSFAGPRRWVAPPLSLERLPSVDVVLISHNHYDHLDLPTVRRLAARFGDAEWLAPLGLAPLLARCGVARVRELDWWDDAGVRGITFTAVPAQHFSSRSFDDRNATLWCGWTLVGAGRRLYFAGDSGYHPDFGVVGQRRGPFDIALLPIGAYNPASVMQSVHLNPEEAVRAFQDVQGGARGVMVGIHWGTFPLTDEPMDEPPRRAREAWIGAGLPPGDLWLPVHGETRRWTP
jgi:N-acyl-phosphatidylethanolamine-hydrolysing phospholipase D